MHNNHVRLNLHKYKTAGMCQFNIDKLSDDDDDDFDEHSSEFEFSDSNESDSYQDTESTGPSEATTDEMQYDRMRAPVLGITAQSRRMSLDLQQHRKSRPSQPSMAPRHPYYQSYDDLRHNGDELYSKIERRDGREYRSREYLREKREPFRQPRQPTISNYRGSRGLDMIEELSPIRSDSLSTVSNEVPPMPPSLRSNSEWNPQLTSTTTSFQPLMPLLPKTNPHIGPKLMCSTPRDSGKENNYNRRCLRNKQMEKYGKPESFSVDSDGSPIPWNEPNFQNIPTANTISRPEHYGLPSALAKNLSINGILFLSMSLCSRRLTINIQKGVYFRDMSQSQVCSYVRAELRHRSKSHSHPKRHCASSLARQTRYEETYRTRLVTTTNRPNFQETFKFKLSENCGRDYLVLTVYAMDASDTQRKKVLGCMAFPISRLLKKARQVNADYFYYSPETENMAEEIEINNEGYFLLDPKYGEKRNLPQSKVKRQTYYNDPTLSGTSGSSFNSQGKMTAASSRLSVPNEMTMGDYYCTTGDLHIRQNPNHLDYTSASSSTNGSSAAEKIIPFHRAPVPSITTTTSENTSDDGRSVMSPNEKTNKVDYHYLCPEDGGVYGAGPILSSGLSVRRAASFTFSPKNSSAKNNLRPQQLRESDENPKEKRKLFGPISKTLSYLRNKMDTALSTSSLYPTKEEVRQWETCFESLLTNKFGCALFRQFLKKEFSDENVDFWLECEEFKKMKDGKKSTTQKAMEIYNLFVAEHAPKEVNLDSDTRAATKAALENGCRTDTFSLAQNRVEQLMSKDSYRRFLRDRLFLDLLESYEDENAPSSSKEK
ncbi:unnamed protein product [Caenorhabditis bovis]|uniref:RGS domain-containing protein n=1 Tax=Caenorhabditis bovis TaxID=2654633 RepID=A0A8S1EDK7_9PELO|nr:unnamed protein product [Caenorhabditis bovis]